MSRRYVVSEEGMKTLADLMDDVLERDADRTTTPERPPIPGAALADFERWRRDKAARDRAERAEQDRDYLLRVIARLEGHNDDDLARMRHLRPEGDE